jgi:hypothetical protein
MKRLKAGLVIVLVLISISIYVFIPGSVDISSAVTTTCNAESAARVISKKKFWEKYQYHLSGVYYHKVKLQQRDGGVESNLMIIPVAFTDSIRLTWTCNIPTDVIPWKRIQRYGEAKAMRKRIQETLLSLRDYLSNKVNVYGIDIKDTMSRDSTLIATKWSGAAYPNTGEIYDRIRSLRGYARGQGAHEMDPPMMHVERLADDHYETMVALPVDKSLKGNGIIFPKRFVPYKILLGVVRGGAASAELGMIQLALFTSENQRTGMAIPFQSLVTERDMEPDTLKWVTHVILPVNG